MLPVTTPVPFVNGTSAVSSTTYTFTVPITTPQGVALVVVCGSSGADASTGVTDTAGNHYTLVTQSTINENVQCYVALAANALTGGVTTITATWATATTQQKNVVGVYIQGAVAVDLAANNNGSSATASVTGGTPAYQYEVGLSIIQITGVGAISLPATATGGLSYQFFTGEFPSGQQITALFWTDLYGPQIPQTLTAPLLGGSQQWSFLLVTFYVNQAVALPATPSVPNFIAGFGPQQSDMTSLWSGPLAFFQNRVVFRALQSFTATTLSSSGVGTTIGFDNVLEDPWGGWNPLTFKWTPPVGYSGVYQVTVTVYVVAPGALQVCLGVYITGNSAYDPESGIQLAQFPIPQLVAGVESVQTMSLAGGQDPVWGQAHIVNSASNLNTNLTAGQQSSIEIVWLGSS